MDPQDIEPVILIISHAGLIPIIASTLAHRLKFESAPGVDMKGRIFNTSIMKVHCEFVERQGYSRAWRAVDGDDIELGRLQASGRHGRAERRS